MSFKPKNVKSFQDVLNEVQKKYKEKSSIKSVKVSYGTNSTTISIFS